MDLPHIDVSIIIPTYGRSTLLCEAIQSCTAQAPDLPLEIIVVDDCSPEPVEPAVRHLPVKLHRLSVNQGSSAARNVGVSLAQGRYLKFLDSDDVLVKGSLIREVALADAKAADIVISGWRDVVLHEDGTVSTRGIGVAPVFGSIADGLLAGFGVPTSAALYRRTTVANVLWDQQVEELNDWDYFVRAALVSRKIETSELIAYDWRSHRGERITTTMSVRKAVDAFYGILEKLIAVLDERGELNQPRRLRAAQYLYKELRRLYRCDPQDGKAMLERIRQLDPDFVPRDEERSGVFRAAGRLGLLSLALVAQSLMARRLMRN